jgi:ATPase family AAA domain-containing protein 3A/B
MFLFKAAKYLDNSANAKSAFDLAAKKEETLQLEHKKQIKEIEVMKVKAEEEEKRKTLQMELHMAKEKSNYDDQLAKQRLEFKLQREKQTQEELARKQEESIQKQEAMKRATMEYEHNLNVSLKL